MRSKELRPEDMRKMMGKKIRLLREINGVTQVELANVLGYTSTGTISLIERGIKGMNNVAVIKAAEFFNVHPVVLFSPIKLEKDEIRILSALMNVFKENKSRPQRGTKTIVSLKRLLGIP